MCGYKGTGTRAAEGLGARDVRVQGLLRVYELGM